MHIHIYVYTYIYTNGEFQVDLFGDKMRTAAQEAVPKIALRDCSKATVGEGQYRRFW